jgi:hypothetical protein
MHIPWNTSDRGGGGQKQNKNQIKKYDFVLNNGITLKKLCRCSIYAVNIIPKLEIQEEYEYFGRCWCRLLREKVSYEHASNSECLPR